MNEVKIVRLGINGCEPSYGDFIVARLENKGMSVLEVRLSGTAVAVMEGNKQIYTQEPIEYIEDIAKAVYAKYREFSEYVSLMITSSDLTLTKENIIETWKHFKV